MEAFLALRVTVVASDRSSTNESMVVGVFSDWTLDRHWVAESGGSIVSEVLFASFTHWRVVLSWILTMSILFVVAEVSDGDPRTMGIATEVVGGAGGWIGNRHVPLSIGRVGSLTEIVFEDESWVTSLTFEGVLLTVFTSFDSTSITLTEGISELLSGTDIRIVGRSSVGVGVVLTLEAGVAPSESLLTSGTRIVVGALGTFERTLVTVALVSW